MKRFAGPIFILSSFVAGFCFAKFVVLSVADQNVVLPVIGAISCPPDKSVRVEAYCRAPHHAKLEQALGE